MATNGYPKIPLKAWRALRSRAASAPSTKFTPPVVAALMGMASPKSAANNTVAPMRRLGLIEEDGSLTPRGNKWRVDASYAEACQDMLDDVYPSDLLALTDAEGSPDPQRVRSWFDHKGFGESNARQMAATYVMIARKTVAQDGETVDRPRAAGKKSATATRRATSTSKAAAGEAPSTRTDAEPLAPTGRTNSSAPNVHLDIQIHIPAEATPEQIDQIFESMARHLYAK
jgi:hypothetical protein